MTGNEDEPATMTPAVAAQATGPARALRPRPGGRQRAPGRTIDGAARDRIGRGLRLHYAEVLALPIPDQFRRLLDDLATRSDTEVQP